MKTALYSLLVLAATTGAALANDTLVIFQKPSKSAAGVADYLASSELKGTTVVITTRSGTVIPVKFYSKLNATILDAYLRSGFSVDVTDCSEHAYPIKGSLSYEGDCTKTTYALRFRCGLFDDARALKNIEPKNYVIRDVVANPLERESTICHSPHHGNL